MKKIVCLLLSCLFTVCTFLSCGAECVHQFVNGVCEKCAEPCTHQFEKTTCKICSFICKNHTYDKGVCSICSNVKLTKEVLVDRSFKYAYFEIGWSSNTTEQQKANLRKQFNVENDEALFDKLYDFYNKKFLEAGSYLVKEVYFKNTQWVHFYKGSNLTSTSYDIEKGNVIVILLDKYSKDYRLTYDKERLLCKEKSADIIGIEITTVLMEV